MLPHVELVDGVITFLQPVLGQNGLGGVDVGRSRRRHQPGALQIGDRFRLEAIADHELLHLPDFSLAVHGDIHRHAGLLHIGV